MMADDIYTLSAWQYRTYGLKKLQWRQPFTEFTGKKRRIRMHETKLRLHLPDVDKPQLRVACDSVNAADAVLVQAM